MVSVLLVSCARSSSPKQPESDTSPVGYAPNNYNLLMNHHKDPIPCGPTWSQDLAVRKEDHCVLVLDMQGESGGGPLVIKEIPVASAMFDLEQIEREMRGEGLTAKKLQLALKEGEQKCPLGFRTLLRTGTTSAQYVEEAFIHIRGNQYFRKSDNCGLNFSGGRFCDPTDTSSSFYEDPIFSGHFEAVAADALRERGFAEAEIKKRTSDLLRCKDGFRKLVP